MEEEGGIAAPSPSVHYDQTFYIVVKALLSLHPFFIATGIFWGI
jgi:hypothetical protein